MPGAHAQKPAWLRALRESGRRDLNPGPPEPHSPGAGRSQPIWLDSTGFSANRPDLSRPHFDSFCDSRRDSSTTLSGSLGVVIETEIWCFGHCALQGSRARTELCNTASQAYTSQSLPLQSGVDEANRARCPASRRISRLRPPSLGRMTTQSQRRTHQASRLWIGVGARRHHPAGAHQRAP